MQRILSSLILSGLLVSTSAVPLNAADQPGAAEAKLREALRAVTLQVRSSQNDAAAAQAAQADAEEKNKALSAQLDALTKQGAADKDAAEKNAAELNGKIAAQATQIAQLAEALDKSRADGKKFAELAAAKEAARARLEEKSIVLQRRVDDCTVKNSELYKLGKEILSRYEKFGLGTALTAREPFVGITRVKLETLVQDYSDKLTDQKISPAQGTSPQTEKEAAPAQKQAGNKGKT